VGLGKVLECLYVRKGSTDKLKIKFNKIVDIIELILVLKGLRTDILKFIEPYTVLCRE
jgi:hypothetical protein